MIKNTAYSEHRTIKISQLRKRHNMAINLLLGQCCCRHWFSCRTTCDMHRLSTFCHRLGARTPTNLDCTMTLRLGNNCCSETRRSDARWWDIRRCIGQLGSIVFVNTTLIITPTVQGDAEKVQHDLCKPCNPTAPETISVDHCSDELYLKPSDLSPTHGQHTE